MYYVLCDWPHEANDTSLASRANGTKCTTCCVIGFADQCHNMLYVLCHWLRGPMAQNVLRFVSSRANDTNCTTFCVIGFAGKQHKMYYVLCHWLRGPMTQNVLRFCHWFRGPMTQHVLRFCHWAGRLSRANDTTCTTFCVIGFAGQ